MLCTFKSNLASTSSPTNTPFSFQRAEQSELTELTEKNDVCNACFCSAFKPLPEQDERNQRHGNVEIRTSHSRVRSDSLTCDPSL